MKNKYYAIFGVLFLLLSLGGAIYLSFQNADTRNKATGNDKCQANQQICQTNNAGKNTGYLCKCITDLDPNDWNCATQDLKECPTEGGGVDPNNFYCDPATKVKISGRCLVADAGSKISVAYKYKCADKFNMNNGCQENETVLRNVGSACFDNNFCGTQQIDLQNQSSCFMSVEDRNCITPTKPVSTNTPTPTRTNTPSPTPTGTVVTPTPTNTNTPTPTGTVVTPTPTNTNTPTPTGTVVTPTPPVISYLGCGYTPCDSTGKICNSGLSCITTNNSNQYCSKPELIEQCKVNPGYAGCCTVPNTQGPSPTRIVLPVSGVNFPVQALTIIGGITTLLGFLILL